MLDILNFVVGSTSTILSALAIYLYIVLWKKDKSDGAYDVFDSMYKDLLSVGLDYPELRDRQKTQSYDTCFSENEKIRYETYAFMVMNFCETIFDRGNEDLLETWGVVLRVEMELHANWLLREENKRKYKSSFIMYMQKY